MALPFSLKAIISIPRATPLTGGKSSPSFVTGLAAFRHLEGHLHGIFIQESGVNFLSLSAENRRNYWCHFINCSEIIPGKKQTMRWTHLLFCVVTLRPKLASCSLSLIKVARGEETWGYTELDL